MTELERQNRPRRFKKLARIAAALLVLVLASGGIAYAAGYNPIKLFVTISEDGKGQIVDEHGNPVDVQWRVTNNPDGSTTAVISPQPGAYSITITPAGESTKAKK